MWPFSKKEVKEQETPEQVSMLLWRDQELQNALLYSSVFQVCSQLTQIWFSDGKRPDSPEQLVQTYAEIYKPLEHWFKGGELKEQIKEMLEVLCPEPPGYEPGETLKYKLRESRE